MQWWCSARNVAWDWSWQPYLGVWVFVAALAALYARHQSGPSVRADVTPRHRAWFAGGLFLLWAALDWPLGPLGASYLATIHVVQFLLVGLLAPVCILLAFPTASYERLRSAPRLYAAVDTLTHPITAFVIFNLSMSVTHWPEVVDAMRVSQLGSFALDLVWLGAGLIFWWPLMAPVPARGFHPLAKIGYLGINAVLIRPPALRLLYAEYPAYATYELAPPIPGTSAIGDQQLAAVLMKVGSAWIMVIGLTVFFVLWHRAEARKAAG